MIVPSKCVLRDVVTPSSLECKRTRESSISYTRHCSHLLHCALQKLCAMQLLTALRQCVTSSLAAREAYPRPEEGHHCARHTPGQTSVAQKTASQLASQLQTVVLDAEVVRALMSVSIPSRAGLLHPPVPPPAPLLPPLSVSFALTTTTVSAHGAQAQASMHTFGVIVALDRRNQQVF